MNFKNYKSLSIDGHLLDGNKIVEYCLRQQQENVRQLGSFVKDWLGDGETITLQTSGSTGVPRQITVDKDQMLQSAAMTAAFFGFKRNDNALLCLPVNYVAGKMMIVRAFYSGLNLVCIEPQSAPLEAVDNDMKIEFAPLVPLQLMNSAATKSVQKILLGGAALSPVLEEKCQRLKADIYHGYGMTETLSHVAIRKINGENRSAIFDALPGISFQIDDRQCLIIHVPFLKGEIVTNDVVELLNSHQFIWKGRADFVVNSGGVKLFPEEIEKKIFAIIQQPFFVAGLPDERLGQKLCLFIEDDRSMETPELIRQLALVLHKYEMPKDILYLKKFETTQSGKIKRKETIGLLKF